MAVTVMIVSPVVPSGAIRRKTPFSSSNYVDRIDHDGRDRRGPHTARHGHRGDRLADGFTFGQEAEDQCWKSRWRVGPEVMKNCESFVSSELLAIDRMPELVCCSQALNSSSKSTPLPPVPLPSGRPLDHEVSILIRWKVRPSVKPCSASSMIRAVVRGASCSKTEDHVAIAPDRHLQAAITLEHLGRQERVARTDRVGQCIAFGIVAVQGDVQRGPGIQGDRGDRRQVGCHESPRLRAVQAEPGECGGAPGD